MFKVALLLRKRASEALERFSDRWLASPWQQFDAAPGLDGHVHNRALPGEVPIDNAPAAVFDAVDEFWFTDEPAARAYFARPQLLSFLQPRAGSLLQQVPLAICGTAHRLWSGAAAAPRGAAKIITLPVRRVGMAPEAFAQHWIHVHSALALSDAGSRARLSHLEPCPSDGVGVAGLPLAPFDGFGSIAFGSHADLAAEFGSRHYREVMAPDEPRFTDPTRSCALIVATFDVGGKAKRAVTLSSQRRHN